MASPTPPPSKNKRPAVARATTRSATEDVSPAWLLKAVGAMLLLALLCGYATLCLLYYQGQWQLVLHPTRTSAAQPPVTGAELVHFAPDESAIPQLTGWWIPTAADSRYAQTTLLILPGADGSLADSSTLIVILHNLGINIFAFDYRGYGQSVATHPSQKNMTEDADNAWRYLTTSRALPASHIVPYGIGVGASLATHLAAAHSEISALILESTSAIPQADLFEAVRRDPRSRLLPARILFHEDFPLAAPLASLPTPKLLLTFGQPPAAFKSAADLKMTVEFNPTQGPLELQPALLPAISRFLDQELPQTK